MNDDLYDMYSHWYERHLASILMELNPTVTTLGQTESATDSSLILEKLQEAVRKVQELTPPDLPQQINISPAMEEDMNKIPDHFLHEKVESPSGMVSIFEIPIYVRHWIPKDEIWVIDREDNIHRYRVNNE